MRYEVRVPAHGEAEASRFELERDEFDAIIEAEWVAGPAQAGYR